ncbi:MAG: succinate dehydrogenase [bacterium]|nr:succinate dehydrogenase [bacterium]
MKKDKMTGKTINIKVFRFDPEVDDKPSFKDYTVPFIENMTAFDALDYIYQNLDSSLAYFDHAGCALGICARCHGKVNGKTGLFCQTYIKGDAVFEPVFREKVIKDLVYKITVRKDRTNG